MLHSDDLDESAIPAHYGIKWCPYPGGELPIEAIGKPWLVCTNLHSIPASIRSEVFQGDLCFALTGYRQTAIKERASILSVLRSIRLSTTASAAAAAAAVALGPQMRLTS